MAVVTSCYGIYYTWHFFVVSTSRGCEPDEKENFGVYSTFFSLRREYRLILWPHCEGVSNPP